MARSERLVTLGWAVFTFVGVTLYCLLWIRQGIDATDEPANLTRHWLFLHGYLEPGSKWFSRVLGGLWLELSAPLGLFGARLGWALTQGLSALAAFGILHRMLGRAKAGLGVLATAVFINGYGIMAVDGYTLPPLLALLAAALLLRAQHPLHPTGREVWFALAGGAVLGLAMLSRLPYVVLLGMLLISPLLKSTLAGPRDHQGWRLAGWALLGTIGVVLLSWMVLGIIGLAGPYALYLYNIFFMPAAHHHSVQNMQASYLAMLLEMVVRGGWGFGCSPGWWPGSWAWPGPRWLWPCPPYSWPPTICGSARRLWIWPASTQPR